MDAKIINGKKIAQNLLNDLQQKLSAYQEKACLAFILVGDDPASQIYVGNKVKACEKVGMKSIVEQFPADISQENLIQEIQKFNENDTVHGLIVQMPLPKHIDQNKIIQAINPAKDVDGFHPVNTGLLAQGSSDGFTPCTPKGIMILLQETLGNDLSGKRAVVLGRSNIVGKPVAQLLSQAGCTVSVCHSKTTNTDEIVKQGDIVISAVGKAGLVKAAWLKKGCTVIDVGINVVGEENGKRKIVGDVEFDQAAKIARAITPVPGGVGPMTIACLIDNTAQAFFLQPNNKPKPKLDTATLQKSF